MKRYEYTIVRPGGNDTCLVDGIVKNPFTRKRINDAIMARYPTVEQVGFMSKKGQPSQLSMAGGEFCGNAARSVAWLLLKKQPGELSLKVSGVKNVLRAGVDQNGNAFSQMPIYEKTTTVYGDQNDPDNFIVELEGIIHYVCLNAQIDNLNATQIKQKAFKKMQVDSAPAMGVMYCSNIVNSWQITPVVYVRAINTLFLETACASGTTALGLLLAKKNKSSIKDMPVLQPSGMFLNISVDYKDNKFSSAIISGPIKMIEKQTIMIK